MPTFSPLFLRDYLGKAERENRTPVPRVHGTDTIKQGRVPAPVRGNGVGVFRPGSFSSARLRRRLGWNSLEPTQEVHQTVH
jgi:hypothetical protein